MVRSKSSSKPRRAAATKPAKKTAAPRSKPPRKPASQPKSSPPKSKASPPKPSPKVSKAPRSPSAPPAVEASAPLPVPLSDEPLRILSLQFVRDGDEFLARLETAGGHITELKNRSLDQLLTMVAGELEDLLG